MIRAYRDSGTATVILTNATGFEVHKALDAVYISIL
jgi:wyosine [tRNA(Phe)-imidazoG37] synthetase (radical SAM superfamily)